MFIELMLLRCLISLLPADYRLSIKLGFHRNCRLRNGVSSCMLVLQYPIALYIFRNAL